MKKVLALAAVAVFDLSSCKKDYTCSCTITTDGISTPFNAEYKGVKKKDAEESCDLAQTTYSQGGATATCELK